MLACFKILLASFVLQGQKTATPPSHVGGEHLVRAQTYLDALRKVHLCSSKTTITCGRQKSSVLHKAIGAYHVGDKGDHL